MEEDPFSPEKHKLILEKLAQQNMREEAFLVEGVKTVPVSQNVLNKLVGKVGEAFEILSHHPGCSLHSKIESLRRALETYRRCYRDFIDKLDAFDEASKDSTLFQRPRKQELETFEIGCRKEIFSLSCAAIALVDIVRRVTTEMTVPGFDEIRKSVFEENQHYFVTELRNNLNHVTFLESDWSIKNLGQGETFHFEFQTAKLLMAGDFNREARDYIEGQGKTIDARNLFTSYHYCVENFYAWLIPEIEKKLPLNVRDFQRCKKEMKANSVRCWYRLLFSQIITPETDLYSHLPKYLTPEEQEEINVLQFRSKEQIDRIIELVDEYEACDDELRKMVYKAFSVNKKK